MNGFSAPVFPQEKEKSCHFVRDRKWLKKSLRQFFLAALILSLSCVLPSLAVLYYLDAEHFMRIWNTLIFAPPMWTIFLVFLIFIIEFSFYFWNQRIIVDARGIQLKGFLFQRGEACYEWREFAQTGCVTLPRPGGALGLNGRHVIAFIDRDGKTLFLLPFKAEATLTPAAEGEPTGLAPIFRRWREKEACHFVGDGHSRSLLEIIERFHGPVGWLDENQDRRMPILPDIPREIPLVTGRLAQATFAAFVITALALYMAVKIAPDVLSLNVWNNNIRLLIYWIAGHAAFVLAQQYLRHDRNRQGALWSSALFATSVVILMVPCVTLFPIWFGTARQETFFLGKYSTNRTQYWRSVAAPGSVYFSLEIAREDRRYNQAGTEHEFTVYRVPPGLRSMRVSELESLLSTHVDDREAKNF
jgi:hypothetical protein